MALSLCSSSVANTGELACDKSRGILKKLFIFNSSIASADYADETTLFNKLVTCSKLSKSDGDKLFVINEAQDIADASDSNKEGSLGLGFKKVLQEGKPSYKVKIFAGGDLLKRLRTYNNQTVRIMEWDANSVLWGSKSGSSFQGFQAKLFFTGNKIASGQNVEEGIVEFTVSILSTSEYFDNAYWANLAGNNIEDVKPLIDAQLAYVSKASNVYKYSVKVPGSNLVGGYDVMSDYGTEIATTTFTAKSGATAVASVIGSALAITSVAYDSANSLLTVTYDNTALGTAGAYITLFPPTPAVLDAADVTNVEIIRTTHAK
jgi:hypothetical protein